MRFLIVATLFLAIPNTVAGETFFVNNISGSDLNTGTIDSNQGNGSGPLRTISAALKRVRFGDQVVLAKTAVPYHECITLQGRHHSGTFNRPFMIDGNGATLDGSAPIPADQWEHVNSSIYRFRPERGSYQRLFLDGKLATELPRVDSQYVTTVMKPKQWCRCAGTIQFAAEKGKRPGAYDLRYGKHPVGITLYDVEHVVIKDLTIRGFQLDGVNAHDNAMDCVLARVNAYACGRSGFSVGGASRLELHACRSQNNGVVQLRTEGWSTTKLTATRLVTAHGDPVWSRQVNGAGRGSRLFINSKPQSALRGYATKEDVANEVEIAPKSAVEAGVGEENPEVDPLPPEQEVEAVESPAPMPAEDPVPDPFGDDADGLSDPGLDAEPDPFDADGLFSDESPDGDDA